MIWLFFLSIFVPLLIADSIRTRIQKRRPIRVLIDLLTAVFHPIDLHFKLVSAKWMRKKLISLNDPFLAPDFKELTESISELQTEYIKHTRLQLGLETIFQTMGNTILLFYAYSSTRTRQELAALFKQDAFNIFGLTLTSEEVVAILLVLNLLSFTKAHYQGIVEGYGSDYKLFGKLTILMTIICACVVKVMSCVMHFATTLGLFNLLRHFQGTYHDHTRYLFQFEKIILTYSFS